MAWLWASWFGTPAISWSRRAWSSGSRSPLAEAAAGVGVAPASALLNAASCCDLTSSGVLANRLVAASDLSQRSSWLFASYSMWTVSPSDTGQKP